MTVEGKKKAAVALLLTGIKEPSGDHRNTIEHNTSMPDKEQRHATRPRPGPSRRLLAPPHGAGIGFGTG